MMAMDYSIQVGSWRIGALAGVSIKRSVEQLSDTATITLPCADVNQQIGIEQKLNVGDAVRIDLGYAGNLATEFEGYLKAIKMEDSVLTLECEDALYLWHVALPDEQLEGVSLEQLLRKIAANVPGAGGVVCDYSYSYDRFTLSGATAYDVLRKVQEETGADIYYADGQLHVHPPYSQIGGGRPVVYDFAANVERSDLRYVDAADRQVCVEVTYRLPDGSQKVLTVGDSKAPKVQKQVEVSDKASAQQAAKAELARRCFSGYEGSLTGWLVPYVAPTYSVEIRDNDYPQRVGTYYVIGTEIEFGPDGGRRKVILGRKI